MTLDDWLTVLAVIVALVGVVNLVQGALDRNWRGIIIGAVLIVLACLIGPDGWNIFGRNK